MGINRVSTEGQGRDARARRHTRALMQLAQSLWQSGGGLQPALHAITATAARVLGLARVSVWQCEDDGALRCAHAYEVSGDSHNPAGFDERLDGVETASSWGPPTTQVLRSCFLLAGPSEHTALAAYLRRHRVESLINSPVRVGGELYGAIFHEHIGDFREWQRDEIAFAGHMRDFVALALEIERRRRAEERLAYLDSHDPVTGLGSRTMFHGAVKDLLRRQRKRPRLASLLFVSVDRFYSVNESVGETGGDAALTELGDRINAVTPDEAIVARVESDCFAVLLPRIAHEWQATQQAEQILETLAMPLNIGGTEFVVSASIGIAFNNGDASTSAEILLRNADLASKQAAHLGRQRCEVFDPEQHRGLLDRLKIEQGLRDGMRNDKLAVVYQPEIRLADNQIVAAEALLRWRASDGSLRSAFEFIDVAETSGLIVPIGRWVLHRACSDAKDWPLRADGSACTLAVNLSARQFEQPGLVDMVTDVLRETGFPAQRLCLEITETTLMSRAQNALDTLHSLKALGLTLAVDDFGTGYSSLAYLKRFPVDTLKIDKTLIDGMTVDADTRAIVSAVISLAKAMELDVVVEGVEQPAQEAELRTMGCQYVQGWLYAKGEPNDQFVARLLAQG
jgi:diguanylate cyclase (GGDEF)-like protein